MDVDSAELLLDKNTFKLLVQTVYWAKQLEVSLSTVIPMYRPDALPH